MLIFVGNLPGEASLLELQNFLGNHEMSVNYSAHRQQNEHSENTHFLLIKTHSHESADELIDELNGKHFHNSQILARRYIQRRSPQIWNGVERRQYQLNLELIFPDN